jgi:hypothetical protein
MTYKRVRKPNRNANTVWNVPVVTGIKMRGKRCDVFAVLQAGKQ